MIKINLMPGIKTKVCPKCGVEKSVGEFCRDKSKKDGLSSHCKECLEKHRARPEVKKHQAEYHAEYYARPEVKKHREEYQAEYYARPEVKKHQAEYDAKRHANPEYKKLKAEYDATRRAKPEYKKLMAEYSAARWAAASPEYKERVAEYQKRPEVKERRNQRKKNRLATDLQFKLRHNVSTSIGKVLKRSGGSKNGSCLRSLPFTIQQLKEHLESQFDQYMCWENHGNYDRNRYTWQIDHIIPHSSFSYSTMDCEEFRQCWALSNLRPLRAIDNIKKRNKIIEKVDNNGQD